MLWLSGINMLCVVMNKAGLLMAIKIDYICVITMKNDFIQFYLKRICMHENYPRPLWPPIICGKPAFFIIMQNIFTSQSHNIIHHLRNYILIYDNSVFIFILFVWLFLLLICCICISLCSCLYSGLL